MDAVLNLAEQNLQLKMANAFASGRFIFSDGPWISGLVNNEQFFDDQNLIVGVSQSDNEQDL